MTARQHTLAIVCDAERVLLGYKKQGFGAGRWNGFGGKVEPGETVEEAAKRELTEEAGLEWRSGKCAGKLAFTYTGDDETHAVTVFCVTAFAGEPRETPEMRPQWFPREEIPYDTMWPDDRQWLPLVLEGKIVDAYFVFDKQHTITHQVVHSRPYGTSE